MTGDGKGLFVGDGTGRPTRIPVPTVFKALSTDTGGQYTFGEHHLREDYPLHVHHREDEGIYMLEGRMTAVVGDDSFSMEPGDFVFMPRGVPHSLTRASESPVRFVFVSTPGGFEHLMEDIVELVGAGHPPTSSDWQALEAKHGWAWQ